MSDHSEASRPASPTVPAAGGGSLTADLPARAADIVDLVVSTIRDRFVRPILIGARAVVFGVVIAVVSIVVVTVACVALIRFMDVYFWPGKVWASYYLLGFILVVGGFVLWSRRSGGDLDRT